MSNRALALCTLLVSTVLCLSTGSSVSEAKPPVAANEPERAVIADDKGLWLIPLDGSKPTNIARGKISWCAADARAGLIWVLRAQSEVTFQLDGIDPDTGKVVAVAKDLGHLDVVTVEHMDEGELGMGSTMFFEAGASLVFQGHGARLEPMLGCDGELAFNCYEDEEEVHLLEHIQARLDAIKKVKLIDKGELDKIAKSKTPLWKPWKFSKESSLRLRAADYDCDETSNGGCGRMIDVPGTKLKLVQVGGSSGDYSYEFYQLYDPAKRQFLDPFEGKMSPKPLKGEYSTESHAISELFISASGKGLLHQGQVASLNKGVVYKDDKGQPLSCGWVGGGWHLKP